MFSISHLVYYKLKGFKRDCIQVLGFLNNNNNNNNNKTK